MKVFFILRLSLSNLCGLYLYVVRLYFKGGVQEADQWAGDRAKNIVFINKNTNETEAK